MGIGLIDIDAKDCMMLKAHQSLSNKELSLRNKTMVDFYISVIKRYRKELLKLSTLIVADAYFSTSTFVNGIKKEGFSLISRFRDNACLFYVYAGPRTGKRGRPKTKDGKIDMKNLDLTRMEKMEMKDIEGTAYTLIAYSKALRCKVRLVIWQMPNGKKKLFFSTDTSLSGEEVLLYYRTRFQIEFCFRDAKDATRTLPVPASIPIKYSAIFVTPFIIKAYFLCYIVLPNTHSYFSNQTHIRCDRLFFIFKVNDSLYFCNRSAVRIPFYRKIFFNKLFCKFDSDNL